MAEQRFDIEIRDLVAKSIRTEILGIASAARDAHSSLRQMKAELGGSAASASQASQATNASARASSEHARQSDAAASAMRREKAAADALAQSYANQARAARSQAGVNSVLGVGGGSGKSARDSAGVFATVAPTASMLAAEKAADKLEKGLGRVGSTSRMSQQHLMNLGFQLNDVAVSLASGQKPLTVFVQQGAQIGQIAAQAGVGLRGMAAAVGGLLAPFWPVIAAVGVAAGAFLLFNKAINDSTSKEELTRGLNLTKEEMKELKNVSVTAGDTIKATFEVVGRAIWDKVGGAVSSAWDQMKEWGSWLGSKFKQITNFMMGSMVGAFKGIMATWRLFPAAIADLFYSAVNMGIDAINGLISASVNGVNGFISQANTILEKAGLEIPTLTAPQIARLENSYAGAAAQVGSAFKAEMDAALSVDYVGAAFDAIRDEAVANARERLARQAAEIRGSGGSGGARGRTGNTEEEKRADAMEKVNRELDSQIALLALYGPALERETKFLAISNQLRDKGITLTAAEETSIRNRIALIQEGTRVQDALNKIEEAALGPMRDHATILSAINLALRDNIISEAEATRQRNLAKTELADGLDPLRAYNEQLAFAEENLGLYGRQLAVQQRAQELFNAAVAAGVANRQDNSRADYEEEARRQQRSGEINSVFQDIDPREAIADTNSFILDNYNEMYAEIQRLREQDVISEQEAAARKQNLDRAHLDARLENTSSMLGQLTALQSSNVKELAAIGKAAAIVQATIDGYRAVQAALVGPPGPPWSFAIAGITGAMAAANVAKIAGIGFMSGGYTGDAPTTAVAGAVHGQEYVFDAAATRRIGVPALNALRSGSNLQGANDNTTGGRGNIRIVQGPGTYVEAVERSDGEIEIIAERVARRVAPRAVAEDMRASPNSATSKAVGQSFGIKRADR
jgi:hypothetical protein